MAYDIFDTYKKRLKESFDSRFCDVEVTEEICSSSKTTEQMLDEGFNNVYGLTESTDSDRERYWDFLSTLLDSEKETIVADKLAKLARLPSGDYIGGFHDDYIPNSGSISTDALRNICLEFGMKESSFSEHSNPLTEDWSVGLLIHVYASNDSVRAACESGKLDIPAVASEGFDNCIGKTSLIVRFSNGKVFDFLNITENACEFHYTAYDKDLRYEIEGGISALNKMVKNQQIDKSTRSLIDWLKKSLTDLGIEILNTDVRIVSSKGEYNFRESLNNRNTLNEDFGTFPEWLKKFFKEHKSVKDSLTKRGIDLAHATYISGQLPKNARDPAFKDLTKLAVFRMYERIGSNFEVVYIPGVTDPDVYPDDLNRWTRYRASAISKKKLLEMTIEYGYIDLNDPRNSNLKLRTDRYAAKQGMVDRDLSAAQHATRTNVEYAKKDNGRTDWDNPISWDIKWVTKKGYDKSGYPLDPDKYGRMLDRVGLDDYAVRLEMLYNKIEAARTRLVAVMDKYTAADSMKVRVKSSWERNIFGDIQRIVSDFSRAIDSYRELQDTVNELVTAEDIDDKEKDRRIKTAFQWIGKRVRDYLKEVTDGLKNAETAETI